MQKEIIPQDKENINDVCDTIALAIARLEKLKTKNLDDYGDVYCIRSILEKAKIILFEFSKRNYGEDEYIVKKRVLKDIIDKATRAQLDVLDEIIGGTEAFQEKE